MQRRSRSMIASRLVAVILISTGGGIVVLGFVLTGITVCVCVRACDEAAPSMLEL